MFTARVNISVPLGERSHREGVTKESVKNSLEQSAAKITSAPVSLHCVVPEAIIGDHQYGD